MEQVQVVGKCGSEFWCGVTRSVTVYNIDGTPNEAGSIKEEVDLICTFGDHSERATFLVTSLGSMGIILGHCYDCNTNSTPVPPVTPVMSPDLICYSGLSS